MKIKTSTFLIILLCILVAVAGGSVSYAYLNKAHEDESQALTDQIETLETNAAKLKSEAKKAKITTTTPTTQDATTTTSDPTANWKTFSKTGYIFSLKYPTDWTITKESQAAIIPPMGSATQNQHVELSNGKGLTIFIDSPVPQIGYEQWNFINPLELTTSAGIVFSRNFGKNTDNSNDYKYIASTKGNIDSDGANYNKSINIIANTTNLTGTDVASLDNLIKSITLN